MTEVDAKTLRSRWWKSACEIAERNWRIIVHRVISNEGSSIPNEDYARWKKEVQQRAERIVNPGDPLRPIIKGEVAARGSRENRDKKKS